MTASNVPAPVLARAMRAFAEFFRYEAAGGIVLIVAAVCALVFVNSPFGETYHALLDLPVEVSAGNVGIAKPLLLWVNDGLMAVFFLLVALEIKREMVGGQLAGKAQIVLPMVCALAGVAVPALIFTALNHDDAPAMRGWAVPTATDIAFALGVLALLGSRVPVGMKLLLSTIAVVDDLVAIVIIAVFYSHGLSVFALSLAVVALVAMFAMNRLGVTSLLPYLLIGAVLWVCVLKSGVHATLAGVATGLLIPHVDKTNAIDDAVEHSPLETLEHALHPWVAFAILPIFAFFNAGLELGGLKMSEALANLPLGIALGARLGSWPKRRRSGACGIVRDAMSMLCVWPQSRGRLRAHAAFPRAPARRGPCSSRSMLGWRSRAALGGIRARVASASRSQSHRLAPRVHAMRCATTRRWDLVGPAAGSAQ
jgi:NhaA family Na+:H+ antiporter